MGSAGVNWPEVMDASLRTDSLDEREWRMGSERDLSARLLLRRLLSRVDNVPRPTPMY